MELQFLQWVNANLHGCTPVNYFFRYITVLGDAGIFWIALGVVLLIFKKTRKQAFVYLIALLIEFIIVNLILKKTINRTRPYELDPTFMSFYESLHFKTPSDTSFPSGHTGAAFVSAMILFLQYGKKAIPALVLASIIALSRLFLCVHFPTDVLGALIVAIAVAYATYYTALAIQRNYTKKKCQSE